MNPADFHLPAVKVRPIVRVVALLQLLEAGESPVFLVVHLDHHQDLERFLPPTLFVFAVPDVLLQVGILDGQNDQPDDGDDQSDVLDHDSPMRF